MHYESSFPATRMGSRHKMKYIVKHRHVPSLLNLYRSVQLVEARSCNGATGSSRGRAVPADRAEQRVDAGRPSDGPDEADNALRESAELQREASLEVAALNAVAPDRALKLSLDVVQLCLRPLAAAHDLGDQVVAVRGRRAARGRGSRSGAAAAADRTEERVDAGGARDRADEPDDALRQAAELERKPRLELARVDAGAADRALELGLDVVELGLGPLAAGQDLRDEIFATVVIVMMAARGGLLLLLRAGAAEEVLDAVEEALDCRGASRALEERLEKVRRERASRDCSGDGARLSLLVARAAEEVLDSIEEAFHGRRAPGALKERLEQVRDERALGEVTARIC
jgi:hypothetical protein